MHKNILVAIDGSKMTSRVLERAMKEVLLKDGTLTILRVLETPEYLWSSPKLRTIMERTKSFLEDELEEMKAEMVKEVPEEKINFFVEYGNPKEKIIDFAKSSEKSDLIIIGATGESEETFAGSTATFVINFASCDVLVVR